MYGAIINAALVILGTTVGMIIGKIPKRRTAKSTGHSDGVMCSLYWY